MAISIPKIDFEDKVDYQIQGEDEKHKITAKNINDIKKTFNQSAEAIENAVNNLDETVKNTTQSMKNAQASEANAKKYAESVETNLNNLDSKVKTSVDKALNNLDEATEIGDNDKIITNVEAMVKQISLSNFIEVIKGKIGGSIGGGNVSYDSSTGDLTVTAVSSVSYDSSTGNLQLGGG